MPIVALPPTTVRVIGSTSIISDPYSLVKELLDNALDASASSVTIEVSQDTVDLIQVKDNGHGIPAPDHTLVCKRTFTSKIHTVEDLQNVGGKSLGFRGEALAGAAEVSGNLTVSTRVESEPVGCSLKYGRNGELISTERVSHPVGTTVRVSNLFRQIPVRRQTAIKNSKKTLLKIRKMIQGYAMVRPSVRFSFKVLKAKGDNFNWVYAPGKHATLMEAALKIAGTEVASNCIAKEWPVLPSAQCELPREDYSGFRLAAVFPKLGSDFTRFNNLGQYISIDSRPVSAGRGSTQDIVKLYKSYLRFASSRDGLSPTITDPFLCLHILCPDGSYDVNVEPSKDDVLFEDQQAVLSLVDGLLQDTYGEWPDVSASKHDPTGQNIDTVHRNGFEVPLSRRPQVYTLISPTPVADSQHGGFVNASSFVRPKSPHHSNVGLRSAVERGPDCSPSVRSNKLRASNTSPVSDVHNKQKASSSFHQTKTTRSYLRWEAELPGMHKNPSGTRQLNNLSSSLSSPVSSSGSLPANTTSLSPPSSRTSASNSGQSQLSPTTPVRSMRQQQRERDRERYGNGSLDTWFMRLSQASQTPTATEDLQSQKTEPSLSQLTQGRFGSERDSPDGASGLEADSPNSERIHGTSGHVRGSGEMSSQIPAQPPGRVNKGKGLPVLDRWSARLYSASNPDENPELQKALEFEARKKAAIQERRMQLKRSEASGCTNSPHQNRYLSARAALNSQPDSGTRQLGLRKATASNAASRPVLRPHDPRAYLMRLQSTDGQGSSKLKRITSSRLPFEKIPEGHDLHTVGLKWPVDLSLLSASFRETSKKDLYTESGDQIEAFISCNINAAIDIWNHRLSGLIRTHYQSINSDTSALRFDFSGISRICNDGDLSINT
ncbi:hypothetical protein BDW62DRAFT_190176 [Aspergillus aurantiobrunneus]